MRNLAGTHAVVVGGVGFLGSHLCTRLVEGGAQVTCLDNFITGRPSNLDHLIGRPGFRPIDYDVSHFIHVSGPVDTVLNSLRRPHPSTTSAGPSTRSRWERWARTKVSDWRSRRERPSSSRRRARSTAIRQSAPNLSRTGAMSTPSDRGVYDEAKRYAEALSLAYERQHGMRVRIARIFNTYGPHMRIDDGRAIPAFFRAALEGRPRPIYGDGRQTRSLCYVDDLIEGLLRLVVSEHTGPMNLGNPYEVSMLELAEAIQDVVGNHPGVSFAPRPVDDPQVRCPDTTLAGDLLDWRPSVSLRDGLERTLSWFEQQMGDGEATTAILATESS